MVIMCVPLLELLCQEAMGWIPTLEHMLPRRAWGLWPYPVMPGSKCRRFPRPRRLVKSM
jgi:hypothetical protein